MSVHEAALYGDLVRFLRDSCAEQLAEARGTGVEEERLQLDEMIRAWFFTPQGELHGYTPQRVIRNEELGIRNLIHDGDLDEILFDDCPTCQDVRDGLEAAGDEEHEHDEGWAFGLAPDMTLLDEYDPEGYEERWRIEAERGEAHLAELLEEVRTLPFAGADDPELAQVIALERRFLEDDGDS